MVTSKLVNPERLKKIKVPSQLLFTTSLNVYSEPDNFVIQTFIEVNPYRAGLVSGWMT